MNKLFIYLALCCFAIFTACENDGDKIIVSGLGSSDIVSSESDIVLTKENKDAPMLALTWNESELTISNQAMSLPSIIPNTILEISDTENFEKILTVEPNENIYSFTGAALNTLAKNFGFTPDESVPMYFRVNVAYGDNTKSYYSNTVVANITSYTIDMTKGFILDSDHAETGFVLYSPDSDGEYYGFTGSGAWFNWYLLEGDGTVWGNDGVDGTEFLLSSDESTHWNFWYPGQGGCYYTTLSAPNQQWTATYIPSLTLSGDLEAEMTFEKSEVKWFVSVTTTTDNATVKVSTTEAKLYNLSTGTSDDAAVAREFGFIAAADGSLSFDMTAANAGDITFGTAGDYTLTFYLADPTNWHYEITEGSTVVEEPVSPYLYLPGIDDGISGSWTFDNYLRLLSEDDLTYAGIVNVNSLYGYELAIEDGNWDDVYKLGETEGSLAFQGADNIPAPGIGLYLLQADLTNLTYSHTEVTSVSYAGFNDDWTLVEMTPASVEGVYTSSVTISAASEWGAQLYLNGGWDYHFGGSEGILYYNGDGLTDDASINTGTYDLVADIINQTYVLLGNEVYITGLNDVWDFESVVLTKSSTGVYNGTATINTPSPWGMAIHIDQSWNRYFGGSFNSLTYMGDNITDDQSLPNGTYNVTIDFINNTCSFEAQ